MKREESRDAFLIDFTRSNANAIFVTSGRRNNSGKESKRMIRDYVDQNTRLERVN